MKKPSRVIAKRYLVGIPVPFLDRNGRKLDRRQTRRWTRAALDELTSCFGGATPHAAAATNIVGGKVLYEEGQVLVLSGCDSRDEFLPYRARIQAFVERMGVALNQHSVFVLAYASDSFLIEITTGRTQRKTKT